MEDIIIGLYARGNSVDDIRYQLRQLYGVELSAGMISNITERVWEQVLVLAATGPLALLCDPYLDGIHFR